MLALFSVRIGVQLALLFLYAGACDEGYFLSDSGCHLCPKGMYQDKKNMTYCEECPIYATTVTEGSKASQDCRVDKPFVCFDVSSFDLYNWTHVRSDNSTVENCLTICSEDGYRFAGYYDLTTCYCGNTVPNDTNDNVSSGQPGVMMVSSVNSNEECDKSSSLQIYKTSAHTTVIYNGDGVMLNGEEYGIYLTGRRGIQFKVRTCDNAILKFLNTSDSSQHIKVIIGGGDGTFWSIGDDVYSYRFFTKDADIVSCTKFLPFWIDWLDNHVRVGRGNTAFIEEIGSYQFADNYKFNVLELASFFGQEQCWKFMTTYDGWNEVQRCADIVEDSSSITPGSKTPYLSIQSTMNLTSDSYLVETSFVSQISSTSGYDRTKTSTTSFSSDVIITTPVLRTEVDTSTVTNMADPVTSSESILWHISSESLRTLPLLTSTISLSTKDVPVAYTVTPTYFTESFSFSSSTVMIVDDTKEPLSNLYVTSSVSPRHSSAVTHDSTISTTQESVKPTYIDTTISSSFTTGTESWITSISTSTVSSASDGGVVYCVTKYYNKSTEDLEAVAMQIRNELAIDQKETSIYKRKHISAWDTRLSAQIIGTTFGPVLLMMIFFIIIIIDSNNLLRMARNIKGSLCGPKLLKKGNTRIKDFRNDETMLKYLHSQTDFCE